MAVRKVNRKKPWQVYWTNPFTAHKESVQFKTEKEALAHDSLIRHRLKFDRESFRPKAEPEIIGKEMTVEELLYAHLAHKRPSKENALRDVSSMRPTIQMIGHIPISHITKAQIMEAQREQAKTVKINTLRVRFSMLRAAFNWAVEQGILQSFPKFSVPQTAYTKIHPPTVDECVSIIEHAAPHIRRVVMLAIYCGMRVGQSELFRIKWYDIDFKNQTIRVWSADKNKDMPWRDVPLHPVLLEHLQQWKEEDGTLEWVIHYEGEPIKSIQTSWEGALKRAGITRRIRPYDLRHAFASMALEAGADLKTVSEIMGHKDTAMVLRTYQHTTEKMKQATVNSLPYMSKKGEQK